MTTITHFPHKGGSPPRRAAQHLPPPRQLCWQPHPGPVQGPKSCALIISPQPECLSATHPGPGPLCGGVAPGRARGHGCPTSALLSLQAIFEILTSEFSYQHSLGILVAEFLQSRELRATMTQMEHHHLFSNITDVLSASQR